MKDRFSLVGDVAFVTGAGSGIGQAIAVGLAEAGADVALFDLPGSAGVHETARQVTANGRKAIVVGGNVMDPRALEQAVGRTEAELGALSVAVNSAGIANAIAAEEMPLSQWQNVFDVNVTGLFLSCQAEGRAMMKTGRGSIAVTS